MTRRRLAEEEQRLEIGVHHRIPIRLGEIERVFAADDAGIVHENVEPAKLVDDCVDHFGDRLDG